jgi:hypothetical protein
MNDDQSNPAELEKPAGAGGRKRRFQAAAPETFPQKLTIPREELTLFKQKNDIVVHGK